MPKLADLVDPCPRCGAAPYTPCVQGGGILAACIARLDALPASVAARNALSALPPIEPTPDAPHTKD